MAGLKVIYQGEAGANSHLACVDAYPKAEAIPAATFEDAFAAVKNGQVDLAMIPIENSVAGRVADIHHLLPESGLYVVGEHFERVRHQLLALKGTKLEDLKTVHSHTMALGQCRNVIRELGLTPVLEADTAGSARMVSENGDSSQAAIASSLAAEIYGLEILRPDVEDAEHNTTRFLILANKQKDATAEEGPVMTSFIFRVRNVPAALYKALGGFATNGVNITKLESYQLEGSFNATMFYADIEGHPSERAVTLALEELDFYTSTVRILGTYKRHNFRDSM
ncbi:MAG: prephenate dehydratase [Rhodomicrobium sp.]|nr:MAG: prephenate dehydratase [Rhodomicrobium sp.]